MGLAERLAKLERAKGAESLVYIIRRLVSPGEPKSEMHTLRRGDDRWERHEGETEAAFLARVRGEVRPHTSGVTYLFGE